MVDISQDDPYQTADAKEGIDYPVPTHDAAANLLQQIKAKDQALRTISEAAAVVDFWLDDLKALADTKDAAGAAYWGILENNATIRKAASEAL